MLAILKRELKNYYTSVFAYVYYALFYAMAGVFFAMNCMDTYSTQFGYHVLQYVFYVIVVILPFCTMKLFALERKYGTDQLLFTAPVSSISVLMGKFLATVVFTFVPVVGSVIYPIIISMYGTISLRCLLSAYIGFSLVVLLLLAIGLFVSTLTTNTVLVVVISYAIYAFILMGKVIEGIATSRTAYHIIGQVSIYNKLNDMFSGIVRSGDIIYLLALTVMFVLLAWIALECRRQNVWKMIGMGAFVVLSSVFVSGVAFRYTKVYDFTAEQLLVFSDQTKEIVGKIDKPTDIYYIGEESIANATLVEFLNAYEDLNDNITVHYKDISTDIDFFNAYLAGYYEVNETSLVVVCGDRYIYLDAADYYDVVQKISNSEEVYLKLEEQLTSAIYYTNSEEFIELTMLIGHSESYLNSDFENMLSLSNYEIEELDLPSEMTKLEKTISDDCQNIMIYTPQTDYTEDEIGELEKFLERGGNLYVVLDTLNEDLPNVYSFLKEYGLDVQSGVVVERDESYYAYDTPYYLLPRIQDTEYTKNIMDNEFTIYSMTSKGILPNGSGNGYISTDLLMTSGTAFSKASDYENISEQSDEDVGGPFSIASCASNPDEGRILLFASDVFFNDQANDESSGANRKFFLEIMNQITGNKEVIWIDGKRVGDQKALYPYNSRGLVKIVIIGIVPFIILLFGIGLITMYRKNIVINLLHKKDDDEKNDEQQEEIEEQESEELQQDDESRKDERNF
ncbi:MAG: Gldg family protein [Lachnospiraceae bacterium]|nr:Gldg family protein [Lachnospiraceae bacterium]